MRCGPVLSRPLLLLHLLGADRSFTCHLRFQSTPDLCDTMQHELYLMPFINGLQLKVGP